MSFFERNVASSQSVMLGIVSAFFGLLVQSLLANAYVLLLLDQTTSAYQIGQYILLFLLQVALAFFILGHAQGSALKGALVASAGGLLGFLALNPQVIISFFSITDPLVRLYFDFMLPQLAILAAGQFLGGLAVWLKSRQHPQMI